MDEPTSDSFVIRPARVADAEQVSAVYLASRSTFLGFAPLVHSDDAARRWIKEHLIPSGGVMVALQREPLESVVGLMALSRDGEAGWIDQLYLHPSVVGRGLGTRFVELAKADLGSAIRLYTFQANEGARRFYERHGFQSVKLGDGSDNEEGCPDILYQWT